MCANDDHHRQVMTIPHISFCVMWAKKVKKNTERFFVTSEYNRCNGHSQKMIQSPKEKGQAMIYTENYTD